MEVIQALNQPTLPVRRLLSKLVYSRTRRHQLFFQTDSHIPNRKLQEMDLQVSSRVEDYWCSGLGTFQCRAPCRQNCRVVQKRVRRGRSAPKDCLAHMSNDSTTAGLRHCQMRATDRVK